MTDGAHYSQDPRAAKRVYYDGGCPVCRREIGWYTRMRGGEQIEWIDISATQVVPEGLPADMVIADLMRRFTITRRDGMTVSGGPGFIALWRGLAPLRWLGRVADHRAGHFAGEVFYRGFLRLRRLWR